MKIQAYKKNCDGDFIVEDENCMRCCLPETEAPDLMKSDDTSCYFKKQPKTPAETERAIGAINISCCGAVRYIGKDKDIINKIL